MLYWNGCFQYDYEDYLCLEMGGEVKGGPGNT